MTPDRVLAAKGQSGVPRAHSARDRGYAAPRFLAHFYAPMRAAARSALPAQVGSKARVAWKGDGGAVESEGPSAEACAWNGHPGFASAKCPADIAFIRCFL